MVQFFSGRLVKLYVTMKKLAAKQKRDDSFISASDWEEVRGKGDYEARHKKNLKNFLVFMQMDKANDTIDEMIDGFNMVTMTVSDIAFEGEKLVVDSAEYLMDMMTPIATAHHEIAPYAGQFPAPDFSTYNMLTVEEILTNGGVDDATLQGIQNVLMNQTLSELMVKILTARPDLMNLVMGTVNGMTPSGI